MLRGMKYCCVDFADEGDGLAAGDGGVVAMVADDDALASAAASERHRALRGTWQAICLRRRESMVTILEISKNIVGYRFEVLTLELLNARL